MKPISAAERKRQIRERRRLKQSRVSSLTASTTASASSETADVGATAQNNDADTDAENGRLKNSLDQDVECSLLHNNIASSSDVGEDKNPSKECQSTSSKTLFSVVMSRSNKDSSSVNNDATKDKNNITSTPKAKKKQISPTKSPGGYDVLKALDVANVYNEHLVKIENESSSNQGENVEPEDEWMDAHVISKRTHLNSDVTYESSVKENLLDGMEAEIIEETRQMIDRSDLKRIKPSVYDEPVGVGVVDWSLKKRLRIESVPGRCLPGTRSSFAMGKSAHEQPLDDGYVHQLAVQYVSNSSMSGNDREPSTAESLEARWKASTMYYQHPSVHPLPPAILQDYPKAEQQMTQCDGDLSSFIRGPRSIYHRLRLAGCGSMGGLGESAISAGEKSKNGSTVSSTSDTSKLLEQRRCEWKEAFRSLFNSWRTKLRHLEARNSTYSNGNGRLSSLKHEKCNPPTTDEVLRCSFYSIRPEQVVLFRSCFMPVNNVDGHVKHCIMPVVVFSSTTVHLRSMLSSMGIKMRVLSGLDSIDKDIEFFSEENLRELDAQIQADGVSGDTESVHAELEAIKWAGVGDGNVTVAQKNKKRKLDDKSFASPLYCVGYNDCSAVFELFINTCGLSLSPHNNPFEQRFGTEVSSDVPLLLYRSLGPCMHFSMKSLCVSGRRDYGYMNQMSSSREDHKPDTSDVRTTLELRGPILPCALRDITCSLVDWMLMDRHHAQSGTNQTLKSNTNDEGVGSHHFALFLQSHEGECAALGPNPTGLSSASLFNGFKISVKQNETSTWHECSHGELLNVMVWDIQRANYVSYNSKHLAVSSIKYS
ncbi:hypothetical protein QTG54_000849 [Skeletonema marinoi]|uniref:Uncharacterized protein n=1 Tax=Skeletonema marinoi TaxID=267567 RepID=A0AAD8YPH5_9STRA|nr:hypothetical protein QTG54_000849 [Skeletonema marinoi]